MSMLIAVALATAASPARDCDRMCMRVAFDHYLLALVTHDAGKAPLAPALRATENGVETPIGQGLWKSAQGYGPMQRRFFDPVSHQAAFYGLVYEPGGPALLSVRVRFEGATIAESEAIVARKGEPLWNPASQIAEELPERMLPPAARTAPAAMRAGVDRYFDAVAGGDPALIPHIVGCNRVENGTRTTNRTAPPGASASAASEVMKSDCAPKAGAFPIKAVAHRRYPVIDTEAGVILGVGLFQRPPGATWADGSPRKRNLLHEYFSYRDGKIENIFAVMRYLDPEEPDSSGWPDK